jgi:DNA repair protein RecO (recombination protein O)
MRQQTSPAIVLRRTNYGEADRIVTFLTPAGKVKAMVKGVRRSKSKLAGGIELFSESTITFLQTSGDLQRIISTRLEEHWDGIIGDLQRMMFGYEAMKILDKIVEEEADRAYYELLKYTLSALGDVELDLRLVEIWFYLRLLDQVGHTPNLNTDKNGKKLNAESLYTFSIDDMCFVAQPQGEFRSEHIKLMRLCLTHSPAALKQVKSASTFAITIHALLKQLVQISTT